MKKYSIDVNKIMVLCESLAYNFGHSLIGSEHLLLAIIKNDTLLKRELSAYKITYDNLYHKIKKLYPLHSSAPAYLEQTIELKNVLENADILADKYKEDIISINIISLALLMSENTMAYELLKKYKVNHHKLVDSFQNLLFKKSDLDNITDLHKLASIDSDPLIGREREIKQLIGALARRNKPNAILVGEPGVGKTAIVEELARRIKLGQIDKLKNKTIYELDLASTVGGTKYRGEFEEKLKKIIKKVMDDGNAILFIDEIHNIVKAGGAEGAIDASNILKPYLSRGQIQIIGATTRDEFINIFEKDKALKRRFQEIKIEPSSIEETKDILYKLKPLYEDYYGINIDDELLDYIVHLADEHLPSFYFPDKAIDILDNSCVHSNIDLTKDNIISAMEDYYKINIHNTDIKERVRGLLSQELIGQDDAIKSIYEALSYMDTFVFKNEKTVPNLLFVGPSGVGKSRACNVIGENIFGKENIISLDMTSYQDPYSINKLIGYSSYLGNESIPLLIKKLKANPKCLIVLEGIDKAHIDIINFFNQLIDQGYFFSSKGELINCQNSLIIMTMNYLPNFEFINNEKTSKKRKILSFAQERLGIDFFTRIDDVVVFDYLDKNSFKKIIKKRLELQNESGLFLLDDVLTYSEREYKQYGVRLLKKDLKKYFSNKIK